MSLYQLSLIINSYASLYPDKIKYFNDLAVELHEKLQMGFKTDINSTD
jgi:hypothetical protein